MNLKPGIRIGPYEMVAQIGAGGMGVVWKARDTELNRFVAIKFLPSDLLSNRESQLRFQREAQAAAALDHPNIAVIHQVGEHEGSPFIVMQLLQGKTLRQVLRAGQLPLEEWLRVATALADGLAHAHRHGIIHRDLKPDNVMITSEGQVKILDFGLAKVTEPDSGTQFMETRERMRPDETELTRAGQVFGTVSYMSPEQARGEPVDSRSDLFSCGILLYEMASGRVPFKGNSAVETLGAIIAAEPPPLSEIAGQLPADAEHVIRKAMEKEPERRYQRAEELATELRDLKRDSRTLRRPWRYLLPVALAIALLATVGYLLRPTLRMATGIGAGGRPAVAVMPFDNPVGPEDARWLAEGIPNMLVTALAQTPGLDVISSQRLHEILRKIGRDDTGTIEKGRVLEVARKAGAGAVVAGSVFQVGSQTRVDVQVDDVGSGRLIFAHSVSGEDVFPLVDQLVQQIRAVLQLATGPARRVAEMTSESLEAYRVYTEGLSAMGNQRYADAQDLYRQAIAIDPAFAMAHYELSSLNAVVGDVAAERAHLREAQKHLDRLPEREKLLVQAMSARIFEGNIEHAAALLEQLIAGYPDEVGAYERLGFIYRDLNQKQRAVDVLERGVTALPNSGQLRNFYAYMLIEFGRYAEALLQFEAYARLEPDEPNPHDSFGEAYLIAGQPERALEQYARALQIDPSFWPSHRGSAWAQAMLGRFDEALDELAQAERIITESGLPRHQIDFLQAFVLSRAGRYREADRQIAEGLSAAELVESAEGRAYLELLSALLALEREDLESVTRSVGRARRIGARITSNLVQQDLAVTAHILLGLADVRSMTLDRAREWLTAAEGVYDPARDRERWMYHCLDGELALATGDQEHARKSFESGEPELKASFGIHEPEETVLSNNFPCRDWRARLAEARGDLPSAIAAYRELLEPGVGRKWTAVLEPRYVLELSRLLERAGDRTGAQASRERFHELWKHADAAYCR